MRAISSIALLALVGGLTVSAPATARADEAATPGTLEFRAQNKVFKAEGKFHTWRFTKVEIPDGDITKGTVEIEVDTSSVEANAERLTNHLKQDDMLKVEEFPKATVKIADAKAGDEDGSYTATATITLRGVSREIPVSFKVTSKEPIKIEGEATVNRLEHGVYTPYNPEDERSVEPDVRIILKAELPAAQ